MRPAQGLFTGLVLVGLLLAPAAARAHLVLGSRTLPQLVAEADLVVRARIVDVRGIPAVSDPVGRRPTVGATPLEVLKGTAPEGELRFAQHGHGVAHYVPGEEALLFLQRVERSRELDALAGSGLAWVSLQEHDEKYAIPPEGAEPLLAAVRGSIRAQALPDPEARRQAMREVTVGMLTSRDARLATSAVQVLAVAEDDPIVGAGDMPALEPVLDDTSLPIGVRIALLSELERRNLVSGPERWVALLASTRGADRTAVIRAAGRHPSPPVAAALFGLLSGDDETAAREAAIALGWPGHDLAVEPLAAALASDDPRMRRAAIRGLGGIGTPAARAALEAASRDHPDPDTRRRARAAATRLPESDSPRVEPETSS